MSERPKMSRENRAKQFMPFAALKGYGELLRRQEKVVVPRMEISEEYAGVLDRKMHQVCRGDIITVLYFEKGEVLKKTGMVGRIDPTARILQVVDTKISFDNIYDVSGPGISEIL